jgi:TRAP-type mannitol/chloroaromatic compound transport system permease small subunit
MLTLLLRVSTAIDLVNRKIGRACIWLILGSILISSGNAITRKLLDASSNAWLEIQWYLFAAAFLGAAGYTLMVNEHVRIDALSQYFSSRARAWIDVLAFTFLVLPFCGLMVYLGGQFFLNAWESGEVSHNAGGLVRWPVYLCMPVGFALLFLQTISEIIKRAAWLAGRRPEAADNETTQPALRFAWRSAGPDLK